jgi:hypothetical protein
MLMHILSKRKLLLRPPKRWAKGLGRKHSFPLVKGARLAFKVKSPSSQGAGRATYLEMLGSAGETDGEMRAYGYQLADDLRNDRA